MTDIAEVNGAAVMSASPYNPMGLVLSRNLTFDEWAAIGSTLGTMERGMNWWIGDWLNYGEHAFGEKYTQAVQETGRDRDSLANLAWVAGRIELSRRRDNLSFTHHTEVASLEIAEQDRFLDAAELNEWSTRALREAVQATKRAIPAAPAKGQRHLNAVPNDPPKPDIVASVPVSPETPDEEEEEGPDPIAQWERAEKELEAERTRSESLQRALESDDEGQEVIRLQAVIADMEKKYAQLEGNCVAKDKTIYEMNRTLGYQRNILDQVRKALDVTANSEILGALLDKVKS